MLLTLSAKSFVSNARKSGEPSVPLVDLPRLAHAELGLMGMGVHASMLAGWEPPDLDRLRDQADKASCPVLMLVEDRPHPIGQPDPIAFNAIVDRLDRVLRVAHRLGCASVAFSLEHKNEAEISETLAQRLKTLVSKAERMEINLLISPAKGITETPERLTGLIRRVGGFRIGSYPDFGSASASGEGVTYLRNLAPYASVVCAACEEFDAKGNHKAWDLAGYVQAVKEVGFDANLALEFRGKGDPLEALAQAKSVVETVLGIGPEEPEAGEDGVIPGADEEDADE